jgi:hypothetical protein
LARVEVESEPSIERVLAWEETRGQESARELFRRKDKRKNARGSPRRCERRRGRSSDQQSVLTPSIAFERSETLRKQKPIFVRRLTSTGKLAEVETYEASEI